MMKVTVLALVFVLACTATAVSAASRQHGVTAQTSWGQPEGSSYWSRLHVAADPAQEVRLSTYSNWTAPSSLVFELDEQGHSALYMGNPNHFSHVRGWYLSIPGDTYALMGAFWWAENCLPGPTVQMDSRQFTITNTTQIPLYLMVGKGWEEIDPGEVVSFGKNKWERGKPSRQPTHHVVEVNTAPSEDAPTCADIRWTSQQGK